MASFLAIILFSVVHASNTMGEVCTSDSPLGDLSQSACEAELKTAKCVSFFLEHPELRDKMRDCQKRILVGGDELLVGCAKGAAQMVVDGAQEVVLFIVKALLSAGDRSAEQQDFIRFCETSIPCKRNLSSLHPGWAKVSDQDLEKASTNQILIEVRHYVETERRSEAFVPKRPALPVEDSTALQTESERAALEDTQKSNREMLWGAAQAYLEDKKIKFQCFNAEARAELACYGLSSLVGGRGVRSVPAWIGKIAGKPTYADLMRATKQQGRIMSSVRLSGVSVEKVRTTVRPLWDNDALSLSEKVDGTFRVYMNERISNMTPERQALAKTAMDEIEKKPNLQNAKWDPRKGQVQIGDPLSDDLITYHSVLVHEFEHLDQYGKVISGSKFKKPYEYLKSFWNPKFSKKKQILYEAEAMGAQWDFLQSIPLKYREEAYRRILESKRMNPALRDIMSEDILLSTRTREDYIRYSTPGHNYTLASAIDMQTDAMARRMIFVGAGALALSLWMEAEGTAP